MFEIPNIRISAGLQNRSMMVDLDNGLNAASSDKLLFRKAARRQKISSVTSSDSELYAYPKKNPDKGFGVHLNAKNRRRRTLDTIVLFLLL